VDGFVTALHISDIHIGPNKWTLQFGEADFTKINILNERYQWVVARGENCQGRPRSAETMFLINISR
jgi:hypothetical protein